MADKSVPVSNPFLALFPSTNDAQNFIKQNKEKGATFKPEEDQVDPNEIIESIFCITINKDRKKTKWKNPRCVVYMSDSSQNVENKQLNSQDVLSQVVFDRIMLNEIIADDIIESDSCPKNLKICATETKVIPYLYHCFNRCLEYKSQSLSDVNDVIKLCQNVTISTSVSVLSSLASVIETDPHQQLFDVIMDDESSSVKFLDEIAKNVHSGKKMDDLRQLFDPLLEIIHEKLVGFSFGDIAVAAHVSVLNSIFQRSALLAQTIVDYCTLHAQDDGQRFENTLLGCIFSFSCLPRRISDRYMFFDQPSRSTSQQHSITEENIWGILFRRIEDCFNLLRSALKSSSPESKDAILTWLGQVIQRNTGRTRIGNQHQLMPITGSAYVSDGFMLNLSAALLLLCEPFTDMQNLNNIMKVRPDYLPESLKTDSQRGVHLMGMPEETCLIPAQEELNVAADSENAFNFVTECFFMTHWCIYSGFCVVHSKMVRVSQDLRDQQQLYDTIRNQAGVGPPETLENVRSVLDQGMTKYLSMKAAMLLPGTLDRMMSFMTASSVWLVNIALGNTSTKLLDNASFPLQVKMSDNLSAIPEFIVDNIIDFVIFVRRFNPSLFEVHGSCLNHLLTFILVFMGNPHAVRNPHLRAKLAEMLECLMPHAEEEIRMESMFSNHHRQALFTSHPHVKEVMRTLLHVFVSIEMTGQSVEFEQKFNYRRPMYIILEFIWKIDIHRKSMKELVSEAEQNMESVDPPLFLRFINLLINDAIFLLDEALSYMRQLREQQEAAERPEWSNLEQRQRTEHSQNLRHMGMLARYHNVMSKETIHALMFITEDIKSVFMNPVLVDRISAMLNYFLVHLTGPKSKEFKVKDLSEYDFKPKQIVSDICQIYLNLGNSSDESEKFYSAVARDHRSYSPKLFNQTIKVLHKIGKADIFNEFEKFAAIIESVHEKHLREEEILGDVPEEFLDPIMNTLMKDPVTLPTSNNVLDRSTISRHLLSDQSDPFNRKPLTMDKIKPNDALREKIEAWLKSHKQS